MNVIDTEPRARSSDSRRSFPVLFHLQDISRHRTVKPPVVPALAVQMESPHPEPAPSPAAAAAPLEPSAELSPPPAPVDRRREAI